MDADSLLSYMHALKLRGKSYSVARRLLDRTSNHWTVFLTREEACELCEVTNWASARRSLKRLADAGLIACHTNELAYIRFLEPPAAAEDRAETARTRALSAQPESDDLTACAESARQRAENARQRAESARTRAVLATPKDQDQDQLQEGRNDPSYPAFPLDGGAGGNQPQAPKVRGSAQSRIDPAEQARSVRMLTDPDVGLYPKLASDAAERHPFRAIAAQVFRYLRDRDARKVRSPGCIPQRLARPDMFPAEMEIDDFDRDLWLRHASDDDLEWGQGAARRKYIPNEYADIILG